MKRKDRNLLILCCAIVLFAAGYEIVNRHTYETLITLCGCLVVGGILYVLIYFLTKGTPDFKKMMDSLPADHKLVTEDIAAIDIGNYRFLYRVYCDSMRPSAKTFVAVEAGIPFPEEEADKGGYSARESIQADYQHLIDSLHEEGILTNHYPVVKDEGENDTWFGQPVFLAFPIKSISASKLADVQGKILGIIEKYGLQDVSRCFICGREYGSEYLYYKGNMLQSKVIMKGTFGPIRSDYKTLAFFHLDEFAHPFSVAGYLELSGLARKNLGQQDCRMGEVRKYAKRMFKGIKGKRITTDTDTDCLSIYLSAGRVANTYYLIHSEGRWWVYADGAIDAFHPYSLDDESAACDLFLRALQAQAE